MSSAEADALAQDPNVESVTIDNQVQAHSYDGKQDYGWMLVTGATSSAYPSTYTGKGIKVAVIDSGMSQWVNNVDNKTGLLNVSSQRVDDLSADGKTSELSTTRASFQMIPPRMTGSGTANISEA